MRELADPRTMGLVEYVPLTPLPNQTVAVNVNGGNKTLIISINTYYDNKSYLSIKYKDTYLVSKAGLKYFVNYLFFGEEDEYLFFLPRNNDIITSINYLDFGKNIFLYYGIAIKNGIIQ